jgi:hypothetical protein
MKAQDQGVARVEGTRNALAAVAETTIRGARAMPQALVAAGLMPAPPA